MYFAVPLSGRLEDAYVSQSRRCARTARTAPGLAQEELWGFPAARTWRRIRVSPGRHGPPSCIANPRFLLQIFDLEKESRASAGQAARFQRAARLADMCGGFGMLAQQDFLARFPGRAAGAEGKRQPCGLLREAQCDPQA